MTLFITGYILALLYSIGSVIDSEYIEGYLIKCDNKIKIHLSSE